MRSIARESLAAFCAVVAACLAGALPVTAVAAVPQLGAIAVPFVEEDAGAAVRFTASIFAGSLAVGDAGELIYMLPGGTPESAPLQPGPDPETSDGRARPQSPISAIAAARRQVDAAKPGSPADGTTPPRALVERFVDGNARPVGAHASPTRVSRFIGADPARHRSRLRTWDRVALGEVFPGIDVSLRATGSNVEKIYEVRPGSDPARIRMAVEGAEALAVGADGRLVATTARGEVAFTAPVAFQEVGGERRPVQVAYAVDAHTAQYGFALGPYDTSRPLVIDPLLQATYYGGTAGEGVYALAVNAASGEVLLAGYTLSTDLPCVTAATAGCAQGVQATASGSLPAFVVRLSADLKTMLQATYFGGGGTSSTIIMAMTWHPVTNEIIVAGQTDASDLPCVSVATGCSGAPQPYNAGANDAFVARLSADLTALRQTTYYGGGGDDYPTRMAIHPVTGDIVMSGNTASTTLFCTSNATGCGQGAQPAHAADGTYDGFVLRLAADLSQFKQGTFVGGMGVDQVSALAIDPATGDIYAGGSTPATTLPCTTLAGTCADAAQKTASTNGDGFIVRLSPDLTQWKQATYIGGNQADGVSALAVHPTTGDLIAAGVTGSSNFPCVTALGVCGAAPQAALAPGGQYDVFVMRLSRDLTQFRQGTYFGGASNEGVSAVAVHPVSGEIYVGGTTYSANLPCAVSNGTCADGAMTPPASASGGKGYVARFSPDLLKLRQTTYYGGSGGETIAGMALHPLSGEVLLAGHTSSTNLPCTTAAGICANGAQPAAAVPGITDGFVVRISADLSAFDTTPAPFAFTPKSSVPPLSVQTSAPVKITGINASTTIAISGQAGATYCAATSPDCGDCNISGGFVSVPGSVFNNTWVCARATAPAGANAETFVTVQVGPQAGRFYVSTGGAVGTGCSLDVDGNGAVDALTDGMILMRAMFGLTGSAVTTGAVGANAVRSTWAAIQPYLNGNCGVSFSP